MRNASKTLGAAVALALAVAMAPALQADPDQGQAVEAKKIVKPMERRAPAYRLGISVKLEELKPGQWLQLRGKVLDVDAASGTVLCEVCWDGNADQPAERIILRKAAGQQKLPTEPIAAQ